MILQIPIFWWLHLRTMQSAPVLTNNSLPNPITKKHWQLASEFTEDHLANFLRYLSFCVPDNVTIAK